MTEKRFTTVFDEQSKMMQYVDTQKEEQWAIWNANKTLQIMNELVDENEELKDDVYDEMDDALEVLVELYEYVPFDSRKKMNRLYNRLKSLRDDMND